MKGAKDIECESCKIYPVCPIEFKYSNISCPCWCCLVKFMCIENCETFNTYLKNYIVLIKKKAKTDEEKKLIPTPTDIFNIRQIRK